MRIFHLNAGGGADCAAQSKAVDVESSTRSCSIAPEENLGAEPPTGSKRGKLFKEIGIIGGTSLELP